MRVMVIVRADADTEAGNLTDRAFMKAMDDFNDDLVRAGVVLAAEGLRPSSAGARVRFEGGRPSTVIDGPFSESKELIAGFWLWQVKSMDEAVEWLKRAPFGGGVEIEIRPIFEMEDFGAAMSEELKAQEARQRAQLANKA